MENKQRITAFISYAHNDRHYFKIFLDVLKRNIKHSKKFNWDLWQDRNIQVGSLWDDEIRAHLENSELAILLVSDSFLASQYIEEKEFTQLLEQHDKKGTLIVPILIAPCDFTQWPGLAERQFFMPRGEDYDKAEIEDFTFADLVKFREKDGKVIPNPNINRYINNFVKAVEKALEEHPKNRKAGTPPIEEPGPGKPEELNDVPFYDIDDLVDRKKLLDEIHQHLTTNKELVLVNGIGGIGKTAIALAYANHPQYSKYYRHVAWVTVASDLQNDLLQKLSNEKTGFNYEADAGDEANFHRLVNTLSKIKANTLLIIDNANNADEITKLKDELQKLQWKILVTTRSNPKHLTKCELKIKELDPENAKQLFKRYFNKTIDEETLDKILKNINRHTLLVELMAKLGSNNPFVDNTKNLLTDLKKGLARLPEISVSTGFHGQGKEVAAARYILAIYDIRILSKVEQTYLRYFSILPSSEINIRELTSFFGIDNSDKYKFADTLNSLVKKGWLITNKNSYKCHQIIQMVLREKLKPNARNCGNVISYFAKVLEVKAEDSHVGKKWVLPYAGNIIQWITGNDKDIATLLENYALLSRRFRRSEKIVKYSMRALRIRKTLFDKNHIEVATSYHSVGLCYASLGKYKPALKFKLKALAIREKVLAKNHLDLAKSHSIIGCTYRYLGKYALAIDHHQQAIKILERKGSMHKLDLAEAYERIGYTCTKMGDFPKALEYRFKALKIIDEILPPEHPRKAYSCNGIAIIYSKIGDLEKALSYHLDVLEIREKVFDKNNPALATTYNNLSKVYWQKKDFPKALHYALTSLEIRKSVYIDESHHVFGFSYQNLAQIYYEMKDYKKAKLYIDLAVQIRLKAYGKENTDFKESLTWQTKIAQFK